MGWLIRLGDPMVVPDERADLVQRPVLVSYRVLIRQGWDSKAAGNMAAYCSGLRPATSAWTPYQIGQMLQLRWESEHSLIGGPDDEPRSPTTPG